MQHPPPYLGSTSHISPSTHPADLLGHHVMCPRSSISSCHVSYAPAVPMCQLLYPNSPELHSPLGNRLVPGLPLLRALNPGNHKPVQLQAPRDARADGGAVCNLLLTLIMHSWLTDIPQNKHPSVFIVKHRHVFQTCVNKGY